MSALQISLKLKTPLRLNIGQGIKTLPNGINYVTNVCTRQKFMKCSLFPVMVWRLTQVSDSGAKQYVKIGELQCHKQQH